jgi:anti-sigma B factor antagonist
MTGRAFDIGEIMNLGPLVDTRTDPTIPESSARSVQIVVVHGELDIATTPLLRERLNDALDTAVALRKRLIIDLSEVSFCDASGLAVLIGTQRRARLHTTSLCLAAPGPQVMRLLHITGLDRGLTIHSTLAAAIRSAPATVARRSQGSRRVARPRARV